MCVSIYNNMYSRIKNTIDSLQGRREGITPSVDAFLRLHGDEPIKQMVISRNVLNPITLLAIGIISPSFARKSEGSPLYHLKLKIITSKSSCVIEKNARIEFSKYRTDKNEENMPVNIYPGLTLNMLMGKTKAYMGGSFLSYSAYSNNCGHFVMAILRANGLSNSQNTVFVEQTTKHLFTGELRKITNTITDIAGALDILRQGGDIKN
jgi:hypothetical protein